MQTEHDVASQLAQATQDVADLRNELQALKANIIAKGPAAAASSTVATGPSNIANEQ